LLELEGGGLDTFDAVHEVEELPEGPYFTSPLQSLGQSKQAFVTAF
jgi:hypothetical protein